MLRTRRCRHAVLLAALVLGAASNASADEAKPGEKAAEPELDRQLIDGGAACREFDEKNEKELALWEKRVEAILAVLARKGLTRSDEGRRALETLGAERYLDSTYAERRIQACANNMILRGVITVDELAAKLAEVDKRSGQLP